MNKYDHKKIELKWQNKWKKEKIYSTKDTVSNKNKCYVLDMFPYPSGSGLHVGHPKGYIATDVYSRMHRMMGFNVLHPMGFDAFGLPAENYAIKNKIHPEIAVKKNISTFKKQLSILGFDYDWNREINTTDPKYYKWTQWIFLKLFEKGLAYESFEPINWCPSCKTGLANEDLDSGKCERCGSIVIKKPMRQWVLKITKYADRLLRDLEPLNWPNSIKELQKNWIGRSEGSTFKFEIRNLPSRRAGSKPQKIGDVEVFTTRADTLFGVTYIVLAPENKIVQEILISNIEILNKKEIENYINEAKKRTEIERTAEGKEKNGVEIEGIKAINPATGEEVPVWIADYVLADYGTGAVMAVPSHDDRDFAFAKKYKLPIKEVVVPERIDKRNPPIKGKEKVIRKNVQAVVRDPKTGKYLILHSKKHHWNTFPMGGVENGEDVLETAKREVIEETGYTDLINGKVLGGQVRAEYFAKHKDQNRISFTSLVSFELGSSQQVDRSAEEIEANDVLWIDNKDLNVNFMVHAEMDIWLEKIMKGEFAYTNEGVLIESGEFSGLTSEEAKKEITNKFGEKIVKYKLRDWVFSRQRYWGEPIPIMYCRTCWEIANSKSQILKLRENVDWTMIDGVEHMIIPVPEKDLPVKLPKVKFYEPTGTGESPLAAIEKWVNVKCLQCKNNAKRETNTMPQWAGSSWYYLRYEDNKNSKNIVDKRREKYWSPVDMYVGGAEHATRHLIYARFWHKFLKDIGVVHDDEPFKKLQHVGLIMGEDGRKMSKRFGNVVNPDHVVKLYGADSMRIYEMFMGPFDQQINWSTKNTIGARRFVEKIWRLQDKVSSSCKCESIKDVLNETIAKVTEDITNFKHNTAISQIMILVNEMDKLECIPKSDYETLLKLIAPFAPHVTEEIWINILHNNKSIHLSKWPVAKTVNKTTVSIAVQVNGKVRDVILMPSGVSEEIAIELALKSDSVSKWVSKEKILKTIFVKDRLLSLVVKN